MKKKVTAPLTYNPGKGRPKEHLAYLNWQEMEALKRLNGNNQERGPMGLPSFPPADARGSSSKASSSKSSSKSTGARGPTGPKGEARTSPAGGKSASGGAGTGKGGDSKAGVGSQKASTNRGPGASMAASKASSKASAGTQKSQAASKPRSSVARGEGAAAGLSGNRTKTMNVGPMGKPVEVKKVSSDSKIRGAIQRAKEPVNYSPPPRYRQPQAERIFNPTAIPTADRSVYERMNAANAEKSIKAALDARIDRFNRDLNLATPAKAPFSKYDSLQAYSGPYGPEMYSAIGSPVERSMLTGEPLVETPKTRTPSTFTDKINLRRMYDSPIGPRLPNQAPKGYGYAVDQKLMEDEIRSLMERDVDTFEEPKDVSNPFSWSGVRPYDIRITTPPASGIDLRDPSQTREIEVEDVPPESYGYKKAKTKESILPFQDRIYDSPYPLDENGIPIQDISEEDLAKIRARRRGEKYVQTPKEKSAAIAGGLVSKVVGKDIPFFDKLFNVKGNIEDYQSRPSWEKEYIKRRADASGGIGDIGGGRSSDERGLVSGVKAIQTEAPSTTPINTVASSSARPQDHYYWDLGLNIPSPTDPNYTQYQEYLRQRAAAQAAMYGTV